ncbi:MAG TPA: hypothetical protein VFG50_16595 [Rhodothermales bacterium]|nr:hypothetical protein [Rhodothermales bacterium]
MMREYNFTVILKTEPSDEQTERLYGYFGAGGTAPETVLDVLIGVRSGIPYLAAAVRAESFEAAINDILPALRGEGLDLVRVEMDAAELGGLLAA